MCSCAANAIVGRVASLSIYGGQQVVHGTSCQGLPGAGDTDNKVWSVRSSEVR